MLLFLPGLICDARMFAPQLGAFPEALAVDSYWMADSLAQMARIALAAADARGAGRLDVFGHSMGGRVALEVLRQAPERVRRLALVSTGVHPLGGTEPEKRAALQRIGREHGFAALVDEWLPPMVAARNRADAALYEQMRAMCLAAGQAQFDAQITALLGRREVEALLPAIACPTLVMTGELDLWAPPAQHAEIAARIAAAELVIVPGAGHMLPLEAPAQVNGAIARWLAGPPRD